MSMQDTAEQKNEQPKAHHQERLRTIQVMAPTCYEFHPERPRHAFELEVGYTDHRAGPAAPMPFESVDLLFKDLSPHVDRQDFLPNLGKSFFFVGQLYMPHDWRPETHHVEMFLPAGLGQGYLNLYNSLGYQHRVTQRETTPRSTVMDLLALTAWHGKLSLDWLFNPALSVEEFLKALGMDKEGKEKDTSQRLGRSANSDRNDGPWASIRHDIGRAASNRNRDGGSSHLHRQGDTIAYFYAETLLPADPNIRQMLMLPAATLVNYVPGF